MAAPSVIEQRLIFTLDDPDRVIIRLSLDCDDAITGPRRFRRTRAGWTLALPRPELNRIEYRLVVTDRGGDTSVICDPENPERVRTAFGERSVAPMPGYERPEWLQEPGPRGTTLSLVHHDHVLGDMPVQLWSPHGLTRRVEAPLLVANDGPEYADLADLTVYAASQIAHGALPPFRIALLQPVERDEWYAANPRYAQTTADVLDTVAAKAPVAADPVVMGASLGGLSAALAVLRPGSPFAAAFSQSGSFFHAEFDEQESSYPHFERVVAEVDSLCDLPRTTDPRILGLTCGRLEENFANNARVSEVLADQGHHVVFRPNDDLHNYTAWRDSLHPTLTELLAFVWTLPDPQDEVGVATMRGGGG